MQRLYCAAHLPEAYLLLHMLEQSGIPARVFNENAQGGVGELPFTHTYPEIWLLRDADTEAAQAVVARFEQCLRRGTGSVTCAHCQEDSPDSFDWCWNCGGSLSRSDSR